MNKLLEAKPELTKSDLEEQIKQKKEKIGAGYLTDQGGFIFNCIRLWSYINRIIKS